MTRRRINLTLRTKGILALVILVAYVATAAWVLAREQRDLYAIGQQVDSHRAMQALLAPIFNTLAHTLVETQSILSAPDFSEGLDPRYAEIAASLDPLMSRIRKLRAMDADIANDIGRLEGAVEQVRAVPSGYNVAQVRNVEQELIARLDDIVSSLQRQTESLASQYGAKHRRISIIAVATSIAGALASVAVILVFFTRLASDIRRLQERSASIVSGYSGPPLRNRRRDEIGGLIDAVNRMQSDLRRSEQQQEINRQQRFHQEKMAAVGSMAAAIGHEVSNPIAAIAGVAGYLIEETREEEDRTGKLAHDFAVQILAQTERISLIMRQLANVTRQHSPEPELLDLNSLVRTTCSFIGYDKRFRGIAFEQDLDHELPALTAVTDHLTQVLMNLLINAADAMVDVAKDDHARIRVATRRVGEEILLEVTDTGHGMTPEVQARAFEESFTTKPAGKGRGIGLFLCQALIQQAGGRIALASTAGAGTTVSVFVPLVQADGTRS